MSLFDIASRLLPKQSLLPNIPVRRNRSQGSNLKRTGAPLLPKQGKVARDIPSGETRFIPPADPDEVFRRLREISGRVGRFERPVTPGIARPTGAVTQFARPGFKEEEFAKAAERQKGIATERERKQEELQQRRQVLQQFSQEIAELPKQKREQKISERAKEFGVTPFAIRNAIKAEVALGELAKSGELAKLGFEELVTSAKKIGRAVTPFKEIAPVERFSSAFSGVVDAISGGVGVAFSPFPALAPEFVEKPVEEIFAFLGLLSGEGARTTIIATGGDPDSEIGIATIKAASLLGQFGGGKLGGKALGRIKKEGLNVIKPQIQRAKEFIKSPEGQKQLENIMSEAGFVRPLEPLRPEGRPGIERPAPLPIPKELEGLTVEARKFKTADKFVESQKEIHHFTPAKFNKFDLRKTEEGTVWFTDSKKALDSPSGLGGAQTGSAKNLNRIDRRLPKNLKIAEIEKAENLFTEQLIDQGFDGVRVPQLDGSVWFEIFDPNKTLKTNKQLTDFFNQAKGVTPEGRLPEQIKAGEQRLAGLRGAEELPSLKELGLPELKRKTVISDNIKSTIDSMKSALQGSPKLKIIKDLESKFSAATTGANFKHTTTSKGLQGIIGGLGKITPRSSEGSKLGVFARRIDEPSFSGDFDIFIKSDKFTKEGADFISKEAITPDEIIAIVPSIGKSGRIKVGEELPSLKAPEPPLPTVEREIATPPLPSRVEKVSQDTKQAVLKGDQSIPQIERSLDPTDRLTLERSPEEVKTKGKIEQQKPKELAPKLDELDKLTTRKIKQTQEGQDFFKFAEENLQNRDIQPALLHRHATITAERVAEFMDEGIGGRTFRELVKPVYDSAVSAKREGAALRDTVKGFKILEGTKQDVNASLFAQNKLKDTTPKAKEFADFGRSKYQEFLGRLNEVREKLDVEPIKEIKDYVTHLNELNVLSELFGGLERVSIKRRISQVKSELLDKHPDWTDARAFDAAKRQVEGTTGVAQYVDARQPIFQFAKERLTEWEKNPSLIRSLNSYSSSAIRYIHQGKNVAKIKAFKDALPANAKEFFRLWNTEQVAGRTAPSFMSPRTRRAVSALRGTLGANTILGNAATAFMQLTSWPQVIAHAGVRNTMSGLLTRLGSYLSNGVGKYKFSRTKALRSLETDIGMGDSLVDAALREIGKFEVLRTPAARTRQAVEVGRRFLMGIMEQADQFTVGTTFEAFYKKGVKDGLKPQDAMEYADIMTGKTQANYFKEGIPPLLNTIEGKVIAQFGTYGMNQWEFFKRDFGKEFKFNEKSPKSKKAFFKQFMQFMIAAYLVDSVSEDMFGRQPYDVKDLVDEGKKLVEGESDVGDFLEQGKETALTYIPFLSSVKFGTLPPVFEFGGDVIQGFLGEGFKQTKAEKDLKERWALSVLLPYGGNQVRKSLQGIESATSLDIPIVKDPSLKSTGQKKFEIGGTFEKMKAILFGTFATKGAREFFETEDEKDRSRERINKAVDSGKFDKLTDEEKVSTTLRNSVRKKNEITGTITDDANIEKLKTMSEQERGLLINTYSFATQSRIDAAIGGETVPERNKRLLEEVTKKPSLDQLFQEGLSLDDLFKEEL